MEAELGMAKINVMDHRMQSYNFEHMQESAEDTQTFI